VPARNVLYLPSTGVKTTTVGGSAWSDKITKTYVDFAAAAFTNDIELFQLGAGEILDAVKMKHNFPFTGGLITAYTASLGIPGNFTKYAVPFNIFQPVSGPVLQIASLGVFCENQDAVTSVRLALTSVGALLNAATQGSLDVWVRLATAR
jgi:hypothetical protein